MKDALSGHLPTKCIDHINTFYRFRLRGAKINCTKHFNVFNVLKNVLLLVYVYSLSYFLFGPSH